MAYDLKTRMGHVGDRMKQINSEDVTYNGATWEDVTVVDPVISDMTAAIPGVLQGLTLEFIGDALSSTPALGDIIERADGRQYRVVSPEDGGTYAWVLEDHARIRVWAIRIT